MSPSELSWVASTVSLGQVVLAGLLVVGVIVVVVGVGVVGVGVVVNGKQKSASKILINVLFL